MKIKLYIYTRFKINVWKEQICTYNCVPIYKFNWWIYLNVMCQLNLFLDQICTHITNICTKFFSHWKYLNGETCNGEIWTNNYWKV